MIFLEKQSTKKKQSWHFIFPEIWIDFYQMWQSVQAAFERESDNNLFIFGLFNRDEKKIDACLEEIESGNKFNHLIT